VISRHSSSAQGSRTRDQRVVLNGYSEKRLLPGPHDVTLIVGHPQGSSRTINYPRISEAESMMANEFLPLPAWLLGMPVPFAKIVTMQFLFVVASDESCFGVFRRSFDGFPSEVNEDL